jgi:hypothetical protein
MIDDLRATALLGTSREPPPRVHTGSEIDGVLASIAPDDRERELLLTAGALAVWQRAGYRPAPAPVPDRAPADTLPGCSDGLADILRKMIRRSNRQPVLHRVLDRDAPHGQTGLSGDHDDLLPEALELLRARGLRLRYHLLPDVLPARTAELRAALRPVLGERGRWLAGFNPTWVWAADPLSAATESLWQTGKIEYRLDLLAAQRRVDPAGGRARLEASFSSDRSEARLSLLTVLEIRLSLDDEPFLERVLDTGSPAARLGASRLLAKLPQSAGAQRLRDRADTMLERPTGTLRRPRVQVTLPTELDPTWQREGLEAQVGLPGLDGPGCWLLHTVGLVPVRHWIERFGVSVEALIAGLRGERREEVLEAWTQAAVSHGERDLLPALWDAWWEHRTGVLRSPNLLATLWGSLAGVMDASALGKRLARLLFEPPEPEATCGRVLGTLPWPWPQAAGDAWLLVLDQVVNGLATAEAFPPAWKHVLIPGARGIPAECIEPALASLANLPAVDGPLDQWRQVLDLVTAKLQIRQQFRQELGR